MFGNKIKTIITSTTFIPFDEHSSDNCGWRVREVDREAETMFIEDKEGAGMERRSSCWGFNLVRGESTGVESRRLAREDLHVRGDGNLKATLWWWHSWHTNVVINPITAIRVTLSIFHSNIILWNHIYHHHHKQSAWKFDRGGDWDWVPKKSICSIS